MAEVVGKIVWHELWSKDLDKGIPFYKKLLGWDIVEKDAGKSGIYQMIQAGGKPIGGFMTPPEEMPSFWVAYITVEDVDESLKSVKEGGGKVLFGPIDMPTVGRFAMVADSEGAVSMVYKSEPVTSPDLKDPSFGEFCWAELMSGDPAGATKFYGGLFNWNYESSDMGEMGKYHIAKRGEFQTSGCMQLPPNVPTPPHWLFYVFVEDLDKTTELVTEFGGEVMMGVMDIPNIGRASIIKDPCGAVLGLFGKKK